VFFNSAMKHAHHRRDDRARRLRQHDERHDLSEGESECASGLGLADGNRVDAGAERLGDVGRRVDPSASVARRIASMRSRSRIGRQNAKKNMTSVSGVLRIQLT
jgi:hypothetical protein